MTREPSERHLALAAWVLALTPVGSCGAEAPVGTASRADASPPECICCLMNEAPTDLGHRLTIAPERTDVPRIKLTGVVYESSGKTPARDVTMYVYQTDETGYYTKRGDEDRSSWAWWHGKQRGWLKTNERGEYEIDTLRPAPYPDGTSPAHIHVVLKAPTQKHCSYVADFVFEGDPLLTARYWDGITRDARSMGLAGDPSYGGVKLTKDPSGRLAGRRNITLLPEYDLPTPDSGRAILAESPAFDPQHAWGPDKGSHACPMCKYGYQPGVLYWVNTDTDWREVEAWTRWLEELSQRSGEKEFKAYLIYSNAPGLSRAQMEEKLSALGRKLNVTKMALTYVPSPNDTASNAALNRINPRTRNTFIVYVNRRVVDKFVNFAFDDRNANLLEWSVRRARQAKAASSLPWQAKG